MPRTWMPESPSYWDADKARIIGEAPAGIFDRRFRAFQPALRILDAKALHVRDRGEAGGLGEASLEGALGEPGTLYHLPYRVGHREVPGEPLLRASDLGVAVIGAALKHDVGRQAVLVPLQRERARQFLRHGGAGVPRDQVQRHVVPGVRRAGAFRRRTQEEA